MNNSEIEGERERREALWRTVLAGGHRDAISPKELSSIGIRPLSTVQGIFRDKERTAALAPPHGVTLSILHVGDDYADSFDEDGGTYRYPKTNRAGRDNAEIEATKNACRLQVPLFVVMPGGRTGDRRAQMAFVADWDDSTGCFLISFSRVPSAAESSPDAFRLRVANRPRSLIPGRPRPGQARFRFCVFKRYGCRCAVCDVQAAELLEAVHLCEYARGGTDDPRNALVLCRNHHRAFDRRLLCVQPATGAILCRDRGPSLTELGVKVSGVSHLPNAPHPEALEWCYHAFKQAANRDGT